MVQSSSIDGSSTCVWKGWGLFGGSGEGLRGPSGRLSAE